MRNDSRCCRDAPSNGCQSDEQNDCQTNKENGHRSHPRDSSIRFRSNKKVNGFHGTPDSASKLNGTPNHLKEEPSRQKKSNAQQISQENEKGENGVIDEEGEKSETDDDSEGPSTSSDPLFGYEGTPVPWATKKYYPLSLAGLHEEMLDAYYWLRPTRLEIAVRYRAFERVRDFIMDLYKGENIRVSVVGSLRTRLFLPTSDIDVLVECADWEKPPIKETAEAFKQLGAMEKVTEYENAHVPIIKLVDKDTKLSIDISFNTVQGVKAAAYMDMVRREFPVIEPLLLILKRFLNYRQLNQAYQGGLSSYGLTLLLVHFLQLHASHLRGVRVDAPWVNLGLLLMRFLEVYGQEMNYSEIGIAVKYCQYRRKGPVRGDEPPLVLSLQDPLLETNEVCRSSYNLKYVADSFVEALVSLRGVFIRDRPHSEFWKKRLYHGTMVAHLLGFTAEEIHTRNWLMGFVMTSVDRTKEQPILKRKTALQGFFFADSSCIAALSYLPKSPKKILQIVHPDDVKVKTTPTTNGRSLFERDEEDGSRRRRNGEKEHRNGEKRNWRFADRQLYKPPKQRTKEANMALARSGLEKADSSSSDARS